MTTRIVLLDANVTDAKGNPVRGLTAKDFAIFEDEKPQHILSFEGPEAHLLPEQLPRATAFDAAEPVAFGNSPVTILVLDEVNTHFADTVYGVHSIEKYLAGQPETLTHPTMLMAVTDSKFEYLSQYTLDREALLRTLHGHRPAQAWQLEQSMSAGYGVADRLDRSLSALEQLAQNAAKIPGHKNLIWVGAGFPSVDPNALTLGTETTLKNMLQHVTDVLLDNRVTMYAVDPTTTAPSTTEITDPVQLAFAAAAGGGARNIDPFDRTMDFDKLAPVTGGKVVRGMNDVDRQIRESVEAGSNYYTLSYRPTDDADVPGKFRHIRIVCLKPGLTATTHDGYYTTAPSSVHDRDTIGYDLNNAATAGVGFHAIRVGAEKDVVDGSYVLHVRAADLNWVEGEGGERSAGVQVLVVGLSAKGKILGHSLQSETATASAGTDVRALGQSVRFTISMKTPVKTARLRFVVRDEGTGRMGSVDVVLK